MTPLRIAFVEGNHRTECAVRQLYGIPVSEPNELYKYNHSSPTNLPSFTPLFQASNTKLLQFGYNSGPLDNAKIEELKMLSKNIAEEKATMVQTSWRQMMVNIVTNIMKSEIWNDGFCDCIDFYNGYIPEKTQKKKNDKTNKDQEGPEYEDEDEDDEQPPTDDRMQRLKHIAEFVSEHMINENPAMKIAKNKDTLADERTKCFNTYMCTPYPRGAIGTPDRVGLNKSRKYRTWEGVEASVVLWLFHTLGSVSTAFPHLQEFLGTTVPGISDLEFVALYIVNPVNHMANTLATQLRQWLLDSKTVRSLGKRQDVLLQQRLKHYARVSYCIQYITILMKFGRRPRTGDHPDISRLVKMQKKSDFNYDPKAKSKMRRDPQLSFDGITQPILLTWPFLVQEDAYSDIASYYRRDKQHIKWLKTLFPDVRNETDPKPWPRTGLKDEDALHCVIPPDLRLSEDAFKEILSGEMGLVEWLPSDVFREKKTKKRPPSESPASPEAKQPKRDMGAMYCESQIHRMKQETARLDPRASSDNEDEGYESDSQTIPVPNYKEMDDMTDKLSVLFDNIDTSTIDPVHQPIYNVFKYFIKYTKVFAQQSQRYHSKSLNNSDSEGA